MKLQYLLAACTLTLTSAANAQLNPWIADTITMATPPSGTTFANDVYYHLDSNETKTIVNNNWHIAFATGALGGVSIIANHAAGNVSVYSLNLKAGGKFGTDLTADTVGKKTKPLFNSIEDYSEGAFNQNYGQSPFDFGWGIYDMATHNIVGDSIYLVTTPSATYQVWIEQFTSLPATATGWKFHTAKLDGTDQKTENILLSNYSNKLFAYYDLATQTIIDREPGNNSWDIVFTRFMDDAMPGVKYPYTGILSNYNTGIAELWDIDADTAQYHNYGLDSTINSIGRDWKKSSFVGTAYNLDTVTYFIQSKDKNIYQMEVTYATTGGGGAKIGFRKRLALKYTPPVNNVNGMVAEANELNIYPNPASNQVNILLNVKDNAANTNILVLDMTGKVIVSKQLPLNYGLNAYSFNVDSYPSGMYIINIATNGKVETRKVKVQH